MAIWVGRGNKVVDVGFLEAVFDLIMFAEFRDEMTQRRRQAQVLQERGAQVPGQAPDIVHHLVQVAQHLQAFLPKLLLLGLQVSFNGPGLQLQDQQGLPQFVVQFPGDPLAFVLLGGEQLGGEMTQILFRFPQFFPGFLALP